MVLTRVLMLERHRARDADYDGRFLVGVLSTGIYCLPSCPAREPKPENVRFFPDEDAARAAGLRACRRCRPDRFYRDRDPDEELAARLAAWIRADPSAAPDARALAERAEVGITKLNALFRVQFHETPAAFLARERVEHARALLAGGGRVLEAALAAGFESPSTFHRNFRRWQGLSPGDYRRLLERDEFELILPAGYRADDFLRYLGRDPESACERRRGARVAKALVLGRVAAVLELAFAPGAVRCTVSSRAALAAEERVRAHRACVRLLGLAQDPATFERRVTRRPDLARLVAGRRGLRIPQTADALEGLVWSVVGQQVNQPFAFALRRRLVSLAGRRAGGGLVAHPTAAEAARVDPADLRARQFSGRKAEYLVELARRVAAGELDLDELRSDPAPRARRVLLAQRGLGPWSANYVQMRSFGLADCVPVGDTGLTSGLQRFFGLAERPDARETQRLLAPFAPHRSFATFHLWNLTGDPA